MAKRKRRYRRKGMGSTIRVRKLNGLGRIGKSGSLMDAALPPLLGGGAAALTTVGIRQAKGAPAGMVEYSPWVGLCASALVASVIYKMQSRPAGVATFIGGLVGTLAIVMSEQLAKMQIFGSGTAGLGAIVPVYSNPQGMDGLGAIVMEPHASRGYGAGQLGSYGEVVSLSGINASAMGSRMFQV